ncbi:TolC family protein [Thermodesulfobacteriota bacterium]
MKAGSLKLTLFVIIVIFGCHNTALGSDTVQLTIDEAVAMALEKNLNLKLQKNEVAIGQGVELVEEGVFDTRVEASVFSQEQRLTSLLSGWEEKEKETLWNVSIKKKLTTGTEFSFFLDNNLIDTDSTFVSLNKLYTSTAGFSVSHPLLKGNSKEVQTAGVRAAEKYMEAATYLVEDQAAKLAAQVKNSYWDLVFSRQDIEVKKLSLELAMNLREETSRKIESGVLAAVEIYQPDSEIARREELLIAAERDIANAEDKLKLLLNSQEWHVAIIPKDTPAIKAQRPELESVLENVLSNRQDIRASDLLVDSAEILASKAEDNLKPSLALSGAAGLTGDGDGYGNSLDDSFSDPKFSWQVGVIFQLPLGNRTSRGTLAKAQAEVNNARYKAELLRQEIIRNAREAVRDVNLALKTIEATRKTTLASQKRLEAEEAKFDVGLSTANDVLEFQDSYAKALISEKRALIDLAKARAELDRVQGIVSFNNRKGEQFLSNSIKSELLISGDV